MVLDVETGSSVRQGLRRDGVFLAVRIHRPIGSLPVGDAVSPPDLWLDMSPDGAEICLQSAGLQARYALSPPDLRPETSPDVRVDVQTACRDSPRHCVWTSAWTSGDVRSLKSGGLKALCCWAHPGPEVLVVFPPGARCLKSAELMDVRSLKSGGFTALCPADGPAPAVRASSR